jgi:hypothetical protein
LQGASELTDLVKIHNYLEKEFIREAGVEAWREHFSVFTEVGNTGKRRRVELPGLIGRWFHLRLLGVDRITGLQDSSDYALKLKLLRSSLFRGLENYPLAAAQWLGWNAITHACMRRERQAGITLRATELRTLHGLRRRCERIEGELSKMVEPVKSLVKHSGSDGSRDLHRNLERAISHLQSFQKWVRDEPSQTAMLEFHRNHLRSFWMFRPPAIAYALFRLLTEHSEPRRLRKDAYRTIGAFEKEYLGRKSRSDESDVEDTVRRQIYTFRASAKRKEMDGILRRLLAGPWYCLDHPLNSDWENPKPLPHPSQ